MAKADTAVQVRKLTDIPNIGVSIAQDLMGLGIDSPEAVKSMDPVATYDALRTPMGQRHDPCVLDTFLAAKEFMNGGPKRPWWDFTEQRKAMLKTLNWR
ncbi:helix-hairpin-helix domain-containing protein [Candidatus Aalborgicola defluviihabitans]|jgi:DNA transformation protein|uniref:helix-hairpin-helix domain-containing protein n=1 Tax=Candidatus Aalborgicola defluviihabitans TaxID=3386187 RepID=UPI001D349258|nr:helix-hairpin-helix domain-containing protein [Burkholderiales bacterium]MBK6567471.1 helix-hairpin-helix domain-containing protein [Burkholderiales bacterium]MBK7282484.1 helix-hairpin-helix domain-containing protein [Burkholderiales bacterium]MBL0244828.1 helix-hairpin-helix domain-containing protein [Rhodoferax sp.]